MRPSVVIATTWKHGAAVTCSGRSYVAVRAAVLLGDQAGRLRLHLVLDVLRPVADRRPGHDDLALGGARVTVTPVGAGGRTSRICVAGGRTVVGEESSSPPRLNTSSEMATASRHATPATVPMTMRRVEWPSPLAAVGRVLGTAPGARR